MVEKSKLVGSLAALLVLAACSFNDSSGASSSLSTAVTSEDIGSVTAASSSSVPPLHLVALGDSLPFASFEDCGGCTGFPTLFGAALEGAAGRAVVVNNRSSHDGLTSTRLLDRVRTDQGIRADLSAADAVLITIGHNDAPWGVDDDTCDGATEHANWDKYVPACVDPLAQRLHDNVGAVLSEISSLRHSQPTLVRVTNFYNDNMKDPLADPGGDASSKAVVDSFSTAICTAAQDQGVRCADIYHAFNGPDGDQFDGEFVAADHVHPAQKGQDLISTTLSNLGYDPLV